MKLIKNLPRKYMNNSWVSMGLFWCDACKQEVERILSNGYKSNSCGSLECKENKGNFKHGECYTKLYMIWNSMKNRILNPNHKFYKNYGGRGITLCPEWAESYIVFKDWALNNGYQEGLEINRIKNNGNYEPNNCNFETRTENMRNTRWNKIKNIKQANEIRYLYSTGNYTQKELAEKYGVSASTISQIVNNKIWVKQ